MLDKQAYMKKWREEHREERAIYSKKWESEHKEERNEYARNLRANNRAHYEELRHKYINRDYAGYRKHIREYRKNRYHTDPKYKLTHLLSRAINQRAGGKNGSHWEELVGYNVNELMAYLETQFTPEMNWDNHGSYWHIDHIKPIAAFQYETVEDPGFKDAWALTNLRPLPATDNLRRPKKYY